MQEEKGFCLCGCGQRTNLADRTDVKKGWVKGEPHKYLCGHATKPKGTAIVVDEATGCWNWQYGKSGVGYGVLWFNGEPHLMHIVMWEGANGKVPEGLELDHLCRNRGCINPDHLEAVTHAENIRRSLKTSLTWNDVLVIRERRKLGDRVKDIAKDYNISPTSATNIIKGNRWKTS